MVGMRVKAESYQGIEQSKNLREVSQCLEKAPLKGLDNKIS